jgi:hypothetical protein
LLHEEVVATADLSCIGPDQDMAMPGAVQQLVTESPAPRTLTGLHVNTNTLLNVINLGSGDEAVEGGPEAPDQSV